MTYTPGFRPGSFVMGTSSLQSIGMEMRAWRITSWASGAWPAANRALFVPLQIPDTITAYKLWITNGGTASGNLDMGVYDEAGNRLVSIGSTAQAGTSAMQILDIADTVLAGPARYYIACAMNGTTGTAWRIAPSAVLVQALGVVEAASSFALPSTVTYAKPSSAYIPLMGLTARSVL